MSELQTFQIPESLTLDNIYKNYGAIRVLEGITLKIERGSSLCLLGRSGCGKSTLLKVIALLTKPDSGRVYFDGKDITSSQESEVEEIRRRFISYSFQEPLLMPYLTALENLTFVLGVEEDRAIDVLTELGLKERISHKPQKLSVGEKKRVDLSRAFLRDCPILIADEPLSNLDPDSGSKVMQLLDRHKEKGGIVAYSSVNPAEAEYADIVINLEKKS